MRSRREAHREKGSEDWKGGGGGGAEWVAVGSGGVGFGWVVEGWWVGGGVDGYCEWEM